MAHPCILASAAVLVNTRAYFGLKCTISRAREMEVTGFYVPALFDQEPCGIACATTDMNTIGTGAVSEANVLFSSDNAANTVEAIISSHHCRCKYKAVFFNFGCDCSLWSALHQRRWGTTPAEPSKIALEFDSVLEKAKNAASEKLLQVKTLRQFAEYELSMLCSNISCPSVDWNADNTQKITSESQKGKQ